MKNEAGENIGSTIVLSVDVLLRLKNKGFKYVQVKGFSSDRKSDYMVPGYLVLVPIKELSTDPNKKDIYEPIDSQLLINWANSPNVGIKVLVALF